MARRRNSDTRLRDLARRVGQGDHDLIPVLAREWVRAGGSELPAIRDVATTFENIESNGWGHLDAPPRILDLFTDLEDYPECDENGAMNADIGYIRGVADALGMTIEELWAESEKARGGEGERRRQAREDGQDELECAQCGGRFFQDASGVANHVDDVGEVDHDQDADHVPYASEDDGDDEGDDE